MRVCAAALAVAALLIAPSAASGQSGVTASGSFVDLDGQTITVDAEYRVDLCFHEPVGNPLAIEQVGVGNIREAWIPPFRAFGAFTCEFFEVGWDIDTSEFSEGTHTFRGTGGQPEDLVASDSWTFTIDR